MLSESRINIANDKIIEINMKCEKGNKVSNFCLNKKCKKQGVFICNDEDCQCNQKHQICQKGNIKVAIKKINKKILTKAEDLKDQIIEQFAKIIDKISQFEEELLKKLESDLKYSQLTIDQEIFLSLFNNQNHSNLPKSHQNQYFNGEILSKIWQNLNESNKQSKTLFNYFLNQIKIFQENILSLIDSTNKKINKLINHNKNIIDKNSKKLSQNFDLLACSSIIKREQDLNRLYNFFSPRKIKQMNLVYKASQNGFRIQKYFEKCGNMKDILIICQTQKGKVFGGYTPLSFLSVNNQSQYIADPSNNSFVFSLTNNEKFPLIQNKNAIYRLSNNYVISFGAGLLNIYDKANQYSNSYTSLQINVYSHGNYPNTKQSYLKLNGYQGQNFTAKQWEAIKLEFE